jgi:hypothetical protein
MRLSESLIAMAAKVIQSDTQIEIDLVPGSDYQGDLSLSWDGNRFHANLVVYSDPHTTYGGGYYDPPETTWREQEDTFEAVKIRDVAEWLKTEWGFDLVKTGTGGE